MQLNGTLGDTRRRPATARECLLSSGSRVRILPGALVTGSWKPPGLAAGPLWQDHGLVFASAVGTPLDDHNVRRQFRVITEAAGLGTVWVPRELRHTFVSLLSAHGVPVEAIALLAGHNQTAT